MNYVIITAAGKGTRANLNVPKQFYTVNGKPLICYTIDVFEKSPLIDKILLVLDSEHIKNAKEFFKKFNFSKLSYFCEGGETNELSIFNGLSHLRKFAKDDDIVLIHDGVRCLVTEEIIADNIEICKKHGNAITGVPCNEAMLFTEDFESSNKYIDRTKIFKTQTPHAIFFKDGYDIFESSIKKGNISSIALCTLLIENGRKVYFSKGSNSNFKITNPEDIGLFESYLKNRGKKEND